MEPIFTDTCYKTPGEFAGSQEEFQKKQTIPGKSQNLVDLPTELLVKIGEELSSKDFLAYIGTCSPIRNLTPLFKRNLDPSKDLVSLKQLGSEIKSKELSQKQIQLYDNILSLFCVREKLKWAVGAVDYKTRRIYIEKILLSCDYEIESLSQNAITLIKKFGKDFDRLNLERFRVKERQNTFYYVNLLIKILEYFPGVHKVILPFTFWNGCFRFRNFVKELQRFPQLRHVELKDSQHDLLLNSVVTKHVQEIKKADLESLCPDNDFHSDDMLSQHSDLVGEIDAREMIKLIERYEQTKRCIEECCQQLTIRSLEEQNTLVTDKNFDSTPVIEQVLLSCNFKIEALPKITSNLFKQFCFSLNKLDLKSLQPTKQQSITDFQDRLIKILEYFPSVEKIILSSNWNRPEFCIVSFRTRLRKFSVLDRLVFKEKHELGKWQKTITKQIKETVVMRTTDFNLDLYYRHF